MREHPTLENPVFYSVPGVPRMMEEPREFVQIFIEGGKCSALSYMLPRRGDRSDPCPLYTHVTRSPECLENSSKFDHSVRVDLTAVLRASLPGKVLGKGQTLGGLDPRKMELIRAELADGFAFHCFRTARIMASCRIS